MHETTALFKTIHGSHLYGLANMDSDLDYYIVVPEVRRAKTRHAKHVVAGKVDVTIIGLSTWLHFCDAGVPQALEAMFSNAPVHDDLAAFRASYRVGPTRTRETYMRTAKNFIYSDSAKKRRHGLRLLHNLKEALTTGRFDPHMPQRQAKVLTYLASTEDTTLRAYETMRGECSAL
jgi:predicted nucleotidyltransferase